MNMKILNASEYGITPEKDITIELINLIDEVKKIAGEKTVVFNTGIYYIDSEKCNKYMLYITNTVGDNEFSEMKHHILMPFLFTSTALII